MDNLIKIHVLRGFFRENLRECLREIRDAMLISSWKSMCSVDFNVKIHVDVSSKKSIFYVDFFIKINMDIYVELQRIKIICFCIILI